MKWNPLQKALSKLESLSQNVQRLVTSVSQLTREVEILRLLAARNVELSLQERGQIRCLQDLEFCVTSQFGDDGIIFELTKGVSPEDQRFIEFGVQDYSESNTRFLLESKNWSGLVIDGDVDAMNALRTSPIFWKHELTSVGAFITRDTINELFRAHGFTGRIGLLSVDIDGNDYWVWEGIDSIDPYIVVAEYNSLFGPFHAVSIPYQADFVRQKAHFSGQYWGASLAALEHLATGKGYRLIGCNSAGNNAYFLKNSYLNEWPAKTASEAFVAAKWRDSRDKAGNLTFATHRESLAQLGEMELIDVKTKVIQNVKTLWNMK